MSLRRGMLGIIVGVFFLGGIAQSQTPEPVAAPDLPRQIETLQIMLERTKGESERCKSDYADLLYQARKLNLDYQKSLQESKKPGDMPVPPGQVK